MLDDVNIKPTIRIILSILFLSECYGATINVPADSTTIQAGINGAEEGDTVLVAAGNYVENITWPSTNGIKLIGSGEDDCFIDGNQESSVIRFFLEQEPAAEGDFGGGDFAGEYIDSTTLITGFTVRNGYAQGDWPNNRGGGIFLFLSNPTFANVTFSGNSANYGGGV